MRCYVSFRGGRYTVVSWNMMQYDSIYCNIIHCISIRDNIYNTIGNNVIHPSNKSHKMSYTIYLHTSTSTALEIETFFSCNHEKKTS